MFTLTFLSQVARWLLHDLKNCTASSPSDGCLDASSGKDGRFDPETLPPPRYKPSKDLSTETVSKFYKTSKNVLRICIRALILEFDSCFLNWILRVKKKGLFLGCYCTLNHSHVLIWILPPVLPLSNIVQVSGGQFSPDASWSHHSDFTPCVSSFTRF